MPQPKIKTNSVTPCCVPPFPQRPHDPRPVACPRLVARPTALLQRKRPVLNDFHSQAGTELFEGELMRAVI